MYTIPNFKNTLDEKYVKFCHDVVVYNLKSDNLEYMMV